MRPFPEKPLLYLSYIGIFCLDFKVISRGPTSTSSLFSCVNDVITSYPTLLSTVRPLTNDTIVH